MRVHAGEVVLLSRDGAGFLMVLTLRTKLGVRGTGRWWARPMR